TRASPRRAGRNCALRVVRPDSRVATLERQTGFFAVNSDAGSHRVFLCIALCLALLGGAFLLDIPMRDWVNAHYSERAEHLMRFITKWGDAPSHLVCRLLLENKTLIFKRRSWAL